jgi:hypothetical protein
MMPQTMRLTLVSVVSVCFGSFLWRFTYEPTAERKEGINILNKKTNKGGNDI